MSGSYRERPEARGATAALVYGIIGLGCCGIVAPIAWIQGNKALARIEASGERLGGGTSAMIGKVLGVVGTIVWIIGSLVGAVLMLQSLFSF